MRWLTPKTRIEKMKIEGSEVAELFRQALRGEVSVRCVGDDWNTIYAGNCAFMFGDWSVVIFNDCLELDYVDSAAAPDGRTGDFDGWYDIGREPVGLLTDAEVAAMESLLESLPAATQEAA
jgi:hypothetical protein